MRRLGFVVFLAACASAHAADVGVVGKKVVIVDKTAIGASAKIVYVATDADVTKGSGTDPAMIGVDLDVEYSGASAGGAFIVPPGETNGTDGWKVNKATVAKYVNAAAPGGPTGVKVAVVKPGKLLKVVGKNRGDAPIDIVAAGPPPAGLTTALTVTNAGETFRHCTTWPVCVHKGIAAGTGAKLVCKNGVASACEAVPSTTSTTTTTSTTVTTTTSSSSSSSSSTTSTSTTSTSTVASCSDGVQNQDETDVDCGGSSCPDCVGGDACVSGADCDSSICAAMVCHYLVDHDYTTTSADWGTGEMTLVGNATWSADPDPLFAGARQLRLTTNGGGEQSAAWYDVATVDASQDWTSTFRFQISYPTGGGADGMAFHVQSDGLGANPNEIGTGLSTPHLTVAIDTWNNGPEGTDESLRVFQNGVQIHFNDLLDFGPDPKPGTSPTVFRMELAYSAGAHTLSIAIDDEGGPGFLLNVISVDLSGFATARMGFSARTGGSAENHDVRTWRFKYAP